MSTKQQTEQQEMGFVQNKRASKACALCCHIHRSAFLTHIAPLFPY